MELVPKMLAESGLTTWITAIGAFVGPLVYVVMTTLVLKDNKRAREDAIAPRLVVFLRQRFYNDYEVVVGNFGSTEAVDVRLDMSGQLTDLLHRVTTEEQQQSFVSNVVVLHPQQQVTIFRFSMKEGEDAEQIAGKDCTIGLTFTNHLNQTQQSVHRLDPYSTYGFKDEVASQLADVNRSIDRYRTDRRFEKNADKSNVELKSISNEIKSLSRSFDQLARKIR